jgi:DNA repair exonuclease SbcCD ATPase subunit
MVKKAAKKKVAPAQATKTPDQLTTKKGFSNVLITDLDTFAKLKDKAGDNVTDAEMLSMLIASYSSGNNQDTQKLTNEITTLHDEILRIKEKHDQEITARIDQHQKLQQDFGDLRDKYLLVVKSTGSETHDTAIEFIKGANDKIQELQAVITEQANNSNGSAELTQQLETCKQELETLENDKIELEKQIKELKANKVELTGNQFIADISDENYNRIDHYKIDLYKKKLISGDSETLPNEVINWAILKAMQVTFGKLEV